MTLYHKVCCVAVAACVGIFFVGCAEWQQDSSKTNDGTTSGLMGTNTNNPTEGAQGYSGNHLNRNTTAGNSSGVGTAGGM